MKLKVELALACVISLIWFQQGLCVWLTNLHCKATLLGAQFPSNHLVADEFSDTSGISNWECTCSALNPGNQTLFKSNCSRSCDCSPVEPSGDRWRCLCATDGFPKVAGSNHDTSCFTACNCTAGMFFKL
ncbi:putative kinase [Corchorus olitorius]|uniref:Kinase n=1 Tax=Corchorus olitorius TaxID=93759 RepID=A0A1R3J9K7_9ROSI|nr:putative kinase [Corchorus olitorius]